MLQIIKLMFIKIPQPSRKSRQWREVRESKRLSKFQIKVIHFEYDDSANMQLKTGTNCYTQHCCYKYCNLNRLNFRQKLLIVFLISVTLHQGAHPHCCWRLNLRYCSKFQMKSKRDQLFRRSYPTPPNIEWG